MGRVFNVLQYYTGRGLELCCLGHALGKKKVVFLVKTFSNYRLKWESVYFRKPPWVGFVCSSTTSKSGSNSSWCMAILNLDNSKQCTPGYLVENVQHGLDSCWLQRNNKTKIAFFRIYFCPHIYISFKNRSRPPVSKSGIEVLGQMITLSKQVQDNLIYMWRNTVRDGGSSALNIAYTTG